MYVILSSASLSFQEGLIRKLDLKYLISSRPCDGSSEREVAGAATLQGKG